MTDDTPRADGERLAQELHAAEEELLPAYKARNPWERLREQTREIKIAAAMRLIADGWRPPANATAPGAISDSTPLRRVKAFVEEHREDGLRCPACTQTAKVYRRKMNVNFARVLVIMWKANGVGWQHAETTVGAGSREVGKLAYWGLVETGEVRGTWRVTDKGREFVHRRLSVPQFARVYNGEALELVGVQVDIQDALGTKFDLGELLRGTKPPATASSCKGHRADAS